MAEWTAGTEQEMTPGTVRGVGPWAVGNAGGEYFAVGRRCRHLGADLANGAIDKNGCLICPWHGARFDVRSGKMVRGPQGIFAKIPGLGPFFRALTSVFPLPRRDVEIRDGRVVVGEGLPPGR